jgi:hypothetical protein
LPQPRQLLLSLPILAGCQVLWSAENIRRQLLSTK